MLSLLAAFRLAQQYPRFSRLNYSLISRIDVLYMPWRVVLPTPSPSTLIVPSWQHNSGMNDRWAFGTRQAIKVYFVQRLSLMMQRAFCWQWRPEGAACLAARSANLTVVPFDVRFVRLRADLAVPDVDLATVAHEIESRGWMELHRSRCTGRWFKELQRQGLVAAQRQWTARARAESQ